MLEEALSSTVAGKSGFGCGLFSFRPSTLHRVGDALSAFRAEFSFFGRGRRCRGRGCRGVFAAFGPPRTRSLYLFDSGKQLTSLLQLRNLSINLS